MHDTFSRRDVAILVVIYFSEVSWYMARQRFFIFTFFCFLFLYDSSSWSEVTIFVVMYSFFISLLVVHQSMLISDDLTSDLLSSAISLRVGTGVLPGGVQCVVCVACWASRWCAFMRGEMSVLSSYVVLLCAKSCVASRVVSNSTWFRFWSRLSRNLVLSQSCPDLVLVSSLSRLSFVSVLFSSCLDLILVSSSSCLSPVLALFPSRL